MAKVQSIEKCVILLALIACHAILSIEGRQLGSMNKKESSGKASSTGGKKIILPANGYARLATAYKDDFRPTTPGNSPGGGDHSFAQDEVDVKSKVLTDHKVSTVGHSVTGFKDAFRPTIPGHSPRVSPALQNENAEPEA